MRVNRVVSSLISVSDVIAWVASMHLRMDAAVRPPPIKAVERKARLASRVSTLVAKSSYSITCDQLVAWRGPPPLVSSKATPPSRSWCDSLAFLHIMDRETRTCLGMFDYADLAQLLVLAARSRGS
jgi:hypothetical protein